MLKKTLKHPIWPHVDLYSFWPWTKDTYSCFRPKYIIPPTSAFLRVPPVITRCPWQHREKGVVEEIQCPHENHHDVPRNQEWNHHHQKTKTCKWTAIHSARASQHFYEITKAGKQILHDNLGNIFQVTPSNIYLGYKEYPQHMVLWRTVTVVNFPLNIIKSLSFFFFFFSGEIDL